ncbi:hypothetical protein FRC08_017505 [Ceratobasidium sp. 394]|nr:hypothetical protein FRC08_017505 [Ceratobasidium sp. 394]
MFVLRVATVVSTPLVPSHDDDEYMLVTKVIIQLVCKGNAGEQTKTVIKTKTHYETVTVGCTLTETLTTTFSTETPISTLTTTVPIDTVTFILTDTSSISS